MILQPDDASANIYYLISGFVRMYSIVFDGKELTLNIFKPGSYFPLFLALDNLKNSYFYESISPVTISKAPKDDVVYFVKNNPDVLLEFTMRMSRGTHGLLTNLQYQLFGSVHRRITSTIYLLSKRFGEITKTGILISLPLTHQDVANLTGIARETASLELEKLQKLKYISYAHRKITIHNLQFLEKEAFFEK